MLLPKAFDNPLMALLLVVSFLLHEIFKARNLAQVLLLFEKNAVALEVGVFNALLGVVG